MLGRAAYFAGPLWARTTSHAASRPKTSAALAGRLFSRFAVAQPPTVRRIKNCNGRRMTGKLTSFVTLARASFSLTLSAGAMLLDRIGRLGGAAAAGGRRDALSYGVSFATTRSHQLARGAPACFLSGISGWFSLSLGAWVPKNLARRKTRRLLTNRPLLKLSLESRFQRTSTRQQLDCAKTQ